MNGGGGRRGVMVGRGKEGAGDWMKGWGGGGGGRERKGTDLCSCSCL